MKDHPTLFKLPDNIYEPIIEKSSAKPRIKTACRNQYFFQSNILDDIIPKDHLARSVWNYVESLDLSIILGKIKSVENNAGRSTIDPKILLTLWLFSTIKSIGSSRAIEQMCKEHDAFKWICGNVNISYHTISDFRSDHGDQLDELLTMSVAVLANSGCISLEKISQDGMRVRANAGSGSFRRENTLNDHLELAQALLKDIKDEEKKHPGACKTRIESAERRAAEERVERIKNAKDALEIIRKEKEDYTKKEGKKLKSGELEKVRASTTDPDARNIKMACGGFRPAFNVQFASTNIGKAIVSVDVISSGCDNKQLKKMIDDVSARYKAVPNKWFVDGGFHSNEGLDSTSKKYPNCKVYMPVKKSSKNASNRYEKKPTDTEAVGEWRVRMGTDEAQEEYKERAATAEYVNANARNRGLQQFLVRGTAKVKCVALIYALTHNMMLQISQKGFNLLEIMSQAVV